MKKNIALKATWFVKAPMERIYAIMSDFERMPERFPAVAESMTILAREGNRLEIEAVAKSFGRSLPAHMETTLIPPRGYTSVNRSPITEIGYEKLLMEEVDGGTEIYYKYEIELKSALIYLISKPLLHWYAMKFWERAVIDKLREMVEYKIVWLIVSKSCFSLNPLRQIGHQSR